MSEILIELCRHNVWATDLMFEACEGLSDEQLDATVDGTFGTIRDTLMHIVGLQERCVEALSESEPAELSRERKPFPGVAALREGARTSGEALVELAAQAKDGATVTTNDRGEDFTLPVWLLFVQAITHAIEHRSQIATILTQQGIEPPRTGGWEYHEETFDADWSRLWSG